VTRFFEEDAVFKKCNWGQMVFSISPESSPCFLYLEREAGKTSKVIAQTLLGLITWSG
jgi:hypothetical protein